MNPLIFKKLNCLTLSLLGAIASISSIKIIAGEFFSASSKAICRKEKKSLHS